MNYIIEVLDKEIGVLTRKKHNLQESKSNKFKPLDLISRRINELQKLKETLLPEEIITKQGINPEGIIIPTTDLTPLQQRDISLLEISRRLQSIGQ